MNVPLTDSKDWRAWKRAHKAEMRARAAAS